MAKIKWLGHAAFEITSEANKKIYIDPWIEGNPACPVTISDLPRPDLVLITHDHFDHLGSAVALLEKGGKAAGQPELVAKLEGISPESLIRMNTGGTVTVDGIKIAMVHAFHSSATGGAVGFILTLENGQVIYHSGDTGIFSDMKLFADLYKINIALLPIGSVFTMDAYQAAMATKMISPEVVIPMHYSTFPALAQTPEDFARQANEHAPQTKVIILKPGEEYTF
ncbi:MAG: metal-dependent hydrolase [Syntrophomonadaceae bacterium]|jgi:L-ascorbate metabolism protein UlaG (beta-lactamase superfamily)